MAVNLNVFKTLAPRMMRDLMRDFAPLADFQAAGIVGNGGGESAGFTSIQELNPTVGGSKGGLGFFQWTGMTPNNPRRRNFEAHLKKLGKGPSDYDANYTMLRDELRTSERATIPAIRAAKNLAEATKAFMVKFERPGVPHYEGRVRWAQMALDAYKAEQSRIVKDPAIAKNDPVPEGTVKEGAPADGVPRPKDNNKSFWTTAIASVSAALVGAYNLFLDALPWVVGGVGFVLLFIYVLRPAYVRWRDYLQYAPEFIDADRKTKLRALFSGFRTKMLARLTEASGVLVVALNAAGNLTGSGIFDINTVLPAIPLSKTISLEASQYLFAITILIGRANEWLRARSLTVVGTIDPVLAVSMAAHSPSVVGSTPSNALANVTDQTGLATLIDEPLPVTIKRLVRRGKAKKAKRKTKRV